MPDSVQLVAKFDSVHQAVFISGIDLEFNQSLADRMIKELDSDPLMRAAYVGSDGRVYCEFKGEASSGTIKPFEPFSCHPCEGVKFEGCPMGISFDFGITC